jgi:hypothetical protein
MRTWFNALGSGDKIALIATVVALLQLVALLLTYRVMRRSARQQLRAYVSGVPDFISSFDETHTPRASFTMRNLGQTPAHNVVSRGEIAALPYPLPIGFKLPPVSGPVSSVTDLFPNVPLIGNRTKATPFTIAELTGIRNGSMRVYIFGEIRYRDVFGRRRRTTFCNSVNPDDEAILRKLASNSTEIFSNIKFEAAPIGNIST